MSTYDPARVVADLRELANRTGGPEGSRRLAWTPEWLQARAFFRESMATLPVEVEEDEPMRKETSEEAEGGRGMRLLPLDCTA